MSVESTVDWRKKVSDSLYQNRARRTGRRKYPYLVHLPSSLEWLKLVDAAAKKKGYNRSAYLRRVISVAVARDLGIDVRVLLQHIPSAQGVGRKNGRYVGDHDDGVGIEAFLG